MPKSFSWSPIRRLMKQYGTSMSSRQAVDELIDYLDSTAKEIIKKASEIAKNSGRKKVTEEDIKNAMKLI